MFSEVVKVGIIEKLVFKSEFQLLYASFFYTYFVPGFFCQTELGYVLREPLLL